MDQPVKPLLAELGELVEEHSDLEAAIEAMLSAPTVNNLAVQRMKKRKLVLKDRIAFLRDRLSPDIIA